jgi:phosphatidylglycerophosphate synthase
MVGAGACYWIGSPAALGAAIVFLGLNWFGDSLDGTLARVRHHERPRYGFYADHVLDVVSMLFVILGLALGGHVSGAIAAAFLIAYYLLMIEIALATYAVGTFRISFWRFGPTELRILLAVGTWRLMHGGVVTIAGGRWLLFDIGMGIGALAILVTFIVSAVMNARRLYRLEPRPTGHHTWRHPLRAGASPAPTV